MEGSQENGLKKGPWSSEEDELLIACIKKQGQGNWQRVPRQAGLNRCGKSCRLRWTNYLKPGIKRGGFSDEEEATIIALHCKLGNKWSRIAAHLPRRTDNEIKNYWNTHLRKKLLRMGIDPKTHKPIPPDLNNILNNLSQTQLFTASSSNLYNCMNPLDAAALNLQANANDLIKIQILQNLLQLVRNNPRPLPYFQGNNNTFSTVDHPLPLQLPDLRSVSSLLNDQNQQPSASNLFPWFEGETIVPPEPLIVNDNVKFGSSYPNNNIPEYSLPSLVSITPESIQPTPETNVFDAWENLMDDDESNSSFWKNILG